MIKEINEILMKMGIQEIFSDDADISDERICGHITNILSSQNHACGDDEVSRACVALSGFVNNLNYTDIDKRTLLAHACKNENKTDFIVHLIQQNIKTNTVDRWGETPLSETARRPCLWGVFGLMVEKGACINYRDGDGNTLIHIICQKCIDSTREDAMKIIRICATKGVHIDKKNNSGETALITTAIKRCDSIMFFLCDEMNADINIQDRRLETAGHHVNRQFGTVELLKNMTSRGLDFEIKNIYNQTASDVRPLIA